MSEVQLKSCRLTTYAKNLLARRWYTRGENFIVSAMLLRKQAGDEYVILHNLCQGIEIILKALLLMAAYDTYKPKLKGCGHNLEKLADEVISTFKVRALPSEVMEELRQLNHFYVRHLLRYGSSLDLLVDPSTISSEAVLRKLMAVLRLTDQLLSQTPSSSNPT
jgi:HEPN domain-containing protein